MASTTEGISTTVAPKESSNNPLRHHTSKQLVEESYDKIAPRYLEWESSRPSPRLRYLHKLLDLLPEHSEVLELGCGAGVPCTQTLLKYGHGVTGNDISGKQIELAKKNAPTAYFLKGDMMVLEFEQKSFGAAMAFYSVIHLPREEQKAMLKKIGGWLIDGGYLLINLGTKDNPGSTNEDWLGGKMYWSGFDANTSVEIIKAAGFDLIEEEITNEEENGAAVQFLWILARKRNVKGS